MAASLEKLFLTFVRRGDARALGRVFDRAGPELLAIASHLVRDPGAAEDLLQATFVGAIENAARFDPRRPLMPWLVGILGKKAKNWLRQSARRVEPDRLARPSLDDPSASSEAGELRTALEAVLAELPTTYRQVLARHLLHGREPREIAVELGRAPGTVRVQLHRGMALLRKALPAGFALGAAGYVGTRGLDAVRRAVLLEARELWTAGTLPAATLGLASGRGAVAVAALTLALGGSYLGWRQSATPAGPAVLDDVVLVASAAPTAPDLSATTASDVRSEAAPRVRSQQASTPRSTVPRTTSLVNTLLMGQVAGPEPSDVARTRVEVRPTDELRSSPLTGHTTQDLRELFDAEPLGGARARWSGCQFAVPVGHLFESGQTDLPRWVVRVDHPDFVPRFLLTNEFPSLARWRPGQPMDLGTIQLEQPVDVWTGTVDEPGHDTQVALIRTPGKRHHAPDVVDVADVDGSGTYALRAPERGDYVVAVCGSGHLPALTTSRRHEFELEPGLDVRGTVDLPVVERLPGLFVVARPQAARKSGRYVHELGWRALIRTGREEVARTLDVRVDERMGFVLSNVPDRERVDLTLRHPDLPAHEPVATRLHPDLSFRPNLGRVRVAVTTKGGPLRDATVTLANGGSGKTSGAGTVDLWAPAPSGGALTARADGYRALDSGYQLPFAGGTAVVPLVLEPSPLPDSTLVLLLSEVPENALRVHFQSDDGRLLSEGATLDGDVALFELLPPGKRTFHLEGEGIAGVTFEAELPSGGRAEHEVTLQPGRLVEVALPLPLPHGPLSYRWNGPGPGPALSVLGTSEQGLLLRSEERMPFDLRQLTIGVDEHVGWELEVWPALQGPQAGSVDSVLFRADADGRELRRFRRRPGDRTLDLSRYAQAPPKKRKNRRR